MDEQLEKYRIKGRVYYKVSEETVPPDDSCIIASIWNIQNVKGEKFRLLARSLGHKEYSLYNDKSSLVFRTRSITKLN